MGTDHVLKKIRKTWSVPFFPPVCTDQIIKINGQENRRKVDKISQLTSNGSTVKILSNVVVSMACIKGSKGSLISIGGYGGCGACPEWHGYYSLDGKLVNYVYSNSFRSFGSLGTRDDLIDKYGVSKKIWWMKVLLPKK
ncbi:hypothetical protein [Pseudomonas sp. IT-232MI5]|jgi:hypothetical protein|uniref:hypothetical protein n=1 Tax=Pseudomonas sp. IT-232MI5 TaxID=3026442 RepID=UPI0039DF68FE